MSPLSPAFSSMMTEDEQHHHRARHRPDTTCAAAQKLRPQQQVEHRQRRHDAYQRNGESRWDGFYTTTLMAHTTARIAKTRKIVTSISGSQWKRKPVTNVVDVATGQLRHPVQDRQQQQQHEHEHEHDQHEGKSSAKRKKTRNHHHRPAQENHSSLGRSRSGSSHSADGQPSSPSHATSSCTDWCHTEPDDSGVLHLPNMPSLQLLREAKTIHSPRRVPSSTSLSTCPALPCPALPATTLPRACWTI